MNKNKAVFYLALVIFLLALFVPFQEVQAFSVTMERERIPVGPSTGDRYQDSPGSPPLLQPAPSQPGTGQAGSGTTQNSYSTPTRTFRSEGTYVPVTPPSSPAPPPTSPTIPPPPSTPSPKPALPSAPSWLTADEAEAFALLNEFRIKNNLPPLQIHYGLTQVARLKAQDMIDHNYFGHVSPTYGSVGQMLRNQGISFTRAAENLSKAGNVSQAHIQLEYSTKGHRQIMLNPNYNHVGIGVLPLKKTPGIIEVQLFID